MGVNSLDCTVHQVRKIRRLTYKVKICSRFVWAQRTLNTFLSMLELHPIRGVQQVLKTHNFAKTWIKHNIRNICWFFISGCMCKVVTSTHQAPEFLLQLAEQQLLTQQQVSAKLRMSSLFKSQNPKFLHLKLASRHHNHYQNPI